MRVKDLRKPACPICGFQPFHRLIKKDGIFCAHCMSRLDRKVSCSSDLRYVQCVNPKCKYYGVETTNPKQGDKCIKCGWELL